MDYREIWVDCACRSPNHAMKVWIDEETGRAMLSIHLLPERNFFRRLLLAFRYLTGRPYMYGEFDDFIVDSSNYKLLRKIVDEIEETQR